MSEPWSYPQGPHIGPGTEYVLRNDAWAHLDGLSQNQSVIPLAYISVIFAVGQAWL